MNTLVGKLNAAPHLDAKLNVAGVELMVANENVIVCDNYLNFPAIGRAGFLYIDAGSNKLYYWLEDELRYFCIGTNYEDIKIINGGGA